MHFIDTTPVARKPHQCCACYRTIDPGEKYRRSFGVGDGDVWTWKECGHCGALVQLMEIADLHAEGYTADDFAEMECTTIQEARWRAQWRRQWRRRDGTLYPIPSREAA